MNTERPFKVTVRPGADGVVLALGGRVDRDAEDGLLAAYEEAAGTGTKRIVLDFGDTTYINSSGLAAIVSLLGRARARDVAVAARGLTSHYRHLFEITRLTDLVEVEHDTPTPEPGGVA